MANLEELITRDTDRSMRSLSQDMNISRTTWERWCRRMDQIAEISIISSGMEGNPSHNRRRTQDWLKKNPTEVCKKEIWPPSSPYCNPVEYFAWGVYELRVRENPDQKIKDLISLIREVIGSLAKNTMTKSCKRFRSRIEAVIAADDNFI